MADRSAFATPEGSARLTATRLAWHAVAEWLLAGPQYRDQGTIRLRVDDGGFATRDGAVRVKQDRLVLADGRAVPLSGTLADVAAEAGIAGGAPESLYTDTSGATPQLEINIDLEAADALADWMNRGVMALTMFAPGEEPVLWPEHFDVGFSVGEVNFGISPGDAHLSSPYAYVGPWQPRQGAFWNESFGASRTWTELADEASVVEFFAAGRTAAGG
ncbi:MAG: hypothetical protein ABI720_09045 [Actinomycetes bacterium]